MYSIFVHTVRPSFGHGNFIEIVDLRDEFGTKFRAENGESVDTIPNCLVQFSCFIN